MEAFGRKGGGAVAQEPTQVAESGSGSGLLALETVDLSGEPPTELSSEEDASSDDPSEIIQRHNVNSNFKLIFYMYRFRGYDTAKEFKAQTDKANASTNYTTIRGRLSRVRLSARYA